MSRRVPRPLPVWALGTTAAAGIAVLVALSTMPWLSPVPEESIVPVMPVVEQR